MMATVTPTQSTSQPPWFVPGDLDGCFGLFFSGLPDLLLIAGLAPLCGFPVELVITRILPGVAISIFLGNCFYSWQARQLAQKTGRTDVTAIPFGVNTPTIFAYISLIMVPVYQRTHDPNLAWQVGVFASFLSGAVQTAGAFCTDWMRRVIPRASAAGVSRRRPSYPRACPAKRTMRGAARSVPPRPQRAALPRR